MEKALDKWYGKLKHEAIKPLGEGFRGPTQPYGLRFLDVLRIKRQAKAVAELETPFERNLREATSNKRWGCPNSAGALRSTWRPP